MRYATDGSDFNQRTIYPLPGSSRADVFLYTSNSEPEPLCGIYAAKGLARVTEMYKSGKLHKHSMKFMLDHLVVFPTILKEAHKNSFRNFNAHAELNASDHTVSLAVFKKSLLDASQSAQV